MGTCHKYPPCLVSQCPAASALAGCGIAVTTGTLGRANVGLTKKHHGCDFNNGKWEDVLILLTSSRGIHANLVKHIHISCESKGWNKNTLNKHIVSDCGNPIVINTLSRRGNATTTLQAVGATSKVTECQQVCRFCQLGNGSKPTMPCSADEHHN